MDRNEKIDSIEEHNPQLQEYQGIDKKENRKRKKELKLGNTIFLLFVIISLGVCSFFVYQLLIDPLALAKDNYDVAKDKAYNNIYEKSYNAAEKKWHVSNDIIIEVEGVRETASLQIMKVHYVTYIMHKKEKDGVFSCLEVSGSGDFTVDLKASEFIVDNERQYVLARIPDPVLKNCKTDKREMLIFNDGMFNGNTGQGVVLAEEDLKEAERKIEAELGSNVEYFEKAQNTAITAVTNLVKQFNPGLDNITVEVEFFE